MEAHKRQEAFLSNTTDSNKAEDVESTQQKMNQILIPLMQMAAVTKTIQMKKVNLVMIQVERSLNQ